jgi:hypothetical protein
MPANKLESAIISASRESADGPEHFLQNEIARAIWKQRFYVFLDVAEKTVRAQLEGVQQPSSSLKRFDMCVFYKHSERIRAVIELKTKATFSSTSIVLDAKKIEKHFAEDTPHASTGYLLAYSEAYRAHRVRLLGDRFRTTFLGALGPNWHLVRSFIGGDDARWKAKGWDAAWGIAL